MNFVQEINIVLEDLKKLLLIKNKAYGNSALEPRRIFSQASAIEQLLVRIDDKLTRIQNQNMSNNEDSVQDLMGYLILLRIAQKYNNSNKKKKDEQKI